MKAPDSILATSFCEIGRKASPIGTGGEKLGAAIGCVGLFWGMALFERKGWMNIIPPCQSVFDFLDLLLVDIIPLPPCWHGAYNTRVFLFFGMVPLKCNVALARQWLTRDSNSWCSTLATRYSLQTYFQVSRCKLLICYFRVKLDSSTIISSALDEPLHTWTSQYLSQEDWHQPLACDHSTARLILDNNSRIFTWVSLKKATCTDV